MLYKFYHSLKRKCIAAVNIWELGEPSSWYLTWPPALWSDPLACPFLVMTWWIFPQGSALWLVTEFSDRAQCCAWDSLPRTLGGIRSSPASLSLEPHPEVKNVCRPILGGSASSPSLQEQSPLAVAFGSLGRREGVLIAEYLYVYHGSSPKFFFEHGRCL